MKSVIIIFRRDVQDKSLVLYSAIMNTPVKIFFRRLLKENCLPSAEVSMMNHNVSSPQVLVSLGRGKEEIAMRNGETLYLPKLKHSHLTFLRR